VLLNSPGPVVLALDEVDRLFDMQDVASDFFGLLRGWHESAKDQPTWSKLRIVIVHSTEVYVTLGVKESPFNVGLSVKPEEFSPDQVADLASRHGYKLTSAVSERLKQLVAGHPYLTRVALFAFTRAEISPDAFFATAVTEQGRYSDHLRRHLWNLEQHPNLLRAMQTVLAAGRNPTNIDSLEAFKLESMGLITRHGNGVTARCDLYEKYLRERLPRVKY
jgi:hypothetical protein